MLYTTRIFKLLGEGGESFDFSHSGEKGPLNECPGVYVLVDFRYSQVGCHDDLFQ